MFDLGSEEDKKEMNEKKYVFEEHEEMSERDLLSTEKEMLGIYISGHPLEKLRSQIERQTNINTMQMKEIDEQNSSMQYDGGEINLEKPKFSDGDHVKYAGIILLSKRNIRRITRLWHLLRLKIYMVKQKLLYLKMPI